MKKINNSKYSKEINTYYDITNKSAAYSLDKINK